MSSWASVALRIVIAIALIGSVVVQVGIVIAVCVGAEQETIGFEVAVGVLAVLGVVTLQVVGVCIWKLLTMVTRGTVFSTAAFKYVDTVIGAIAVGAGFVFALAVVARFANHATPGDEIAPGLVALVCGLALVLAGVALVVYVMRTLLAQAVGFRRELDEVI